MTQIKRNIQPIALLLLTIGTLLCTILYFVPPVLNITKDSVSTINRKEPIEIFFFHETVCGSCDGTAAFIDIFNIQLKDVISEYPYTLQMHNVFQTEGSNAYNKIVQKYNLDSDSISFPALFINGRVISGLDEIEKQIKELYLSAQESAILPTGLKFTISNALPGQLFDEFTVNPNDSTILYFYRITCDECNETKPIIDNLPGKINANGQKSNLKLFKLNTKNGSNLERIKLLFKEYNVPEQEQQVPIVFFRDTYLSGYDEISANLKTYLDHGYGLAFAFPVIQQ